MLNETAQKVRNFLSNALALQKLSAIEESVDRLRLAVGRLEIGAKLATERPKLNDYEAQIYSQNGEDGILQRLIQVVPIEDPTFVEFGVEDYREANTRFLLINNNWRGLVIDGSQENVERIRRDWISWKHDLTAVCTFIDRDNINDIIERAGFHGDLGILSVDIDGNDYWVWEAITCVKPRIVVAEYNATFGPSARISVPYDPLFQRNRAHHSNLYYGASLAALEEMAVRKGYRLVGTNTAGNNVFFVREDLAGALPRLNAAQAFVQARFRESRSADGSLTYLAPLHRAELISQLSVVDVVTRETITISQALRLGYR